MVEGQVGGRTASNEDPLRCAVLLSGSGTGMEALVRAQQGQNLLHQTTVVISNKADAAGVGRAQSLGLPTVVIEHQPVGESLSREEHEQKILDTLLEYDVELVVLSGYMRLLSPSFLSKWGRHVVNIHPSLLPHFPGAHAHRDVLAAKVSITGCTVHLVDDGMDTGAIIAQRSVPVLKKDDEQRLSERVKVEEHRLYPTVLTWIAEGRVHHEGSTVSVDGLEVLQPN